MCIRDRGVFGEVGESHDQQEQCNTCFLLPSPRDPVTGLCGCCEWWLLLNFLAMLLGACDCGWTCTCASGCCWAVATPTVEASATPPSEVSSMCLSVEKSPSLLELGGMSPSVSLPTVWLLALPMPVIFWLWVPLTTSAKDLSTSSCLSYTFKKHKLHRSPTFWDYGISLRISNTTATFGIGILNENHFVCTY